MVAFVPRPRTPPRPIYQRCSGANQGTLFLDEVGDIPIEIPPKLLRALQEREFERLGSTYTRKVNVRIVAATNRDLERMTANREFRSDLYYRLNVFPIRIPALRERKGDIPPLVHYYMQKFSRQMHKNIECVPPAVMKGLIGRDWPGNVRELENVVERSVILTRGSTLEVPLSDLRTSHANRLTEATGQRLHDDISRVVNIAGEHAVKREEIVRVLTETRGRVGGAHGAAARMSINRTTLLSRMKRLGIDRRQFA